MGTEDVLTILCILIASFMCGLFCHLVRSSNSESIPTNRRLNPYDFESTRRAPEVHLFAEPPRYMALYVANRQEHRQRHREQHPLVLTSIRLEGPIAEGTCSICLDAFGTSSVTVGECMHMFHSACIASWLAKESSHHSCPVCRARFRAKAEPAAATC